jgi:hypothetical protein
MKHTFNRGWWQGICCRRTKRIRTVPPCRSVRDNVTELTDILETYTIEEILELNDLTTEDLLEFLVEEDYITLPEIKPL